MLGGVAFEAGQGQGAGGLGDGAHVVEDVAYGGGGLVGGDGDDVVEQGPAHAEGLLADAAHGHPFGEQAHVVQGDGLATQEGGLETGRLLVLDADDLDSGHELLDEDGDAGARPPPPTGTKTRSRWASCWMSSRPMVPWPAMTRGSSKGAM